MDTKFGKTALPRNLENQYFRGSALMGVCVLTSHSRIQLGQEPGKINVVHSAPLWGVYGRRIRVKSVARNLWKPRFSI